EKTVSLLLPPCRVRMLYLTALVFHIPHSLAAKSGECPPVPPGSTCVVPKSLCQHDGDCPGPEKCCSDGCGLLCTKPIL
uniref:WAP domain-containing protein n=1 Tax=Podarcis muralis TaxID=64176 RepID=A0A670IH11_PODMU